MVHNGNGQGDSESKNIEITFDDKNTNLLKVTTINLPADNYTEYFTLTYTLVDDDGNTVYLDSSGNKVEEGTVGAISEWTYSLKNNYYNKTTLSNVQNKFYRGMLPESQQGYYLKTIKYTISTIRAGAYLYSTGGTDGTTSGGVFLGYVDSSASAGTTITSTLKVISSSGNFDDVIATNTTKTSTSSTMAYGMEAGKINNVTNNNINIMAGESCTLSGYILAIQYPYGSALWMRDIVIALVLPEGITVNEESIKLWTTSSSNTFSPDKITRETASDGNIIWRIYAPSSLVLGYSVESIGALSEGTKLNYNIQLDTSYYMNQQTLNLQDIVFCASTSQSNAASGSYASVRVTDTYDLNENDSTTDKIGCFNNNTSTIEITPQSATFDISDDLKVTYMDNTTSTGTDLNLVSKDDIITYNLNLECTGGGTVNNFEYYIPIPKKDFNTGEYLITSTERAFDTNLQDEVTISGQDLYNIYYTLDEDLNYSTISDETTWYTADEMAENSLNYNDVTIIKIVPKEETIENGSSTIISIKLKYDGDTYNEEAGMTDSWAGCGHYSYTINGRETTGTFTTDGVKATLTYSQTLNDITLTAAKDMTPLTDGNVRTASSSVGELPTFLNSQNYKITKVQTYNVTLQTSEYMEANTDMAGTLADVQFGVTASLNSGTATDVLSTAETTNIEVGTNTGGNDTIFTYTLYNADALSDVSKERYILITYETDNGVTLTQKIKIQLEIAEAEDPQSSIVEGSRYKIYDETQEEITISQDSSFTAQFVADYAPYLYPEKNLVFSSNMPVGTDIIVLDKLQDSTNYTYWYYTVEEEKSSISLTELKKMGTSDTSYASQEGTDEIEEIFLVLVDFKNSSSYLGEGSYSLDLELSGANVDTVTSSELNFNIKSQRTFEINTSLSTVKYGEDFSINYEMTASEGTETLYSGKKVSIVLTAKSAIPVDTYIEVDGTKYYQNANNQFIIGGDNITEESGTVSLSINSNLLKHTGIEYEFGVGLWVGATTDALLPLMGDKKCEITLTVEDEANQTASLKVTGITKRLIDCDELKNSQQMNISYIIDNSSTATIELQQKVGNAYQTVTDKLNSVDGNTSHTMGVFTLSLDSSTTSKTIEFKLANSTDTGTYRIIIKIYDENNEQILEVPYNLLVI